MYQLTFLQFVVKNLFQCFVRLIERETCLHFGKMPWFALKCEGCKIDVTRQGCSPDDIVGVGTKWLWFVVVLFSWREIHCSLLYSTTKTCVWKFWEDPLPVALPPEVVVAHKSLCPCTSLPATASDPSVKPFSILWLQWDPEGTWTFATLLQLMQHAMPRLQECAGSETETSASTSCKRLQCCFSTDVLLLYL